MSDSSDDEFKEPKEDAEVEIKLKMKFKIWKDNF